MGFAKVKISEIGNVCNTFNNVPDCNNIIIYVRKKKEKKGNHVMFGCKLKISIKLLNGGNSNEQFT